MKRICLLLPTILVLCAAYSSAQEKAATPAELTAEELKAGLDILEQRIDTREGRITELTNDIVSLNDRVESRIDRIVEMLKGVTDTVESRTRVARMKEKAIAGLRRTIDEYDAKRRTLKSETMQRSPRVTREELFNDQGVFDEKVEKRVSQIIELSKSLQTHQDYDKWRTVYGDDLSWGWGNGWGDSVYQVRNPRYYQNRSETTRTEQSRGSLVDELKQSIERLGQRNRQIGETLKKEITPQYRKMLENERDRNSDLISGRGAQIEEVTMSSSPSTEGIGRQQALNIEGLINDMSEDLERDFYRVFQIYTELNQERTALKPLRESYAKHTAMLQAK